MTLSRRAFLKELSVGAVLPAVASLAPVWSKTDHDANSAIQLRIEPTTLDIGPGVCIRTLAYNGQVPGPLLRLKQGVPVTIDVTNASSYDEIVHWHGLRVGTVPDGAVEEGSPAIPPGRTLRYSFTPEPAGTRWYHTHAMAMDRLDRAGYTGQFGFLLVDGKDASPRVDHEVHLAVHHWEPSFVPMVETMRAQSANVPQTSGSDVGYRYATMNGHMLGAGEPVRVKRGDRVLLRLLNASATENVILALPGHRFHITAMDGNPVPHHTSVEILSLAVAERVDAIVEMNTPGVWVLGSTNAAERAKGLGVVIEYAGSQGEAVWRDPAPAEWDYTQFAGRQAAPEPAETFALTFRDAGALGGAKFDTWTINGESWPHVTPMLVDAGKRYRMAFRNASGDQHPMHLHRHSFEVTRIGDIAVSGLWKDVINVMPLQTVWVDFNADNIGDALMHCHQQLHMDYGFMHLVRYRS